MPRATLTLPLRSPLLLRDSYSHEHTLTDKQNFYFHFELLKVNLNRDETEKPSWKYQNSRPNWLQIRGQSQRKIFSLEAFLVIQLNSSLDTLTKIGIEAFAGVQFKQGLKEKYNTWLVSYANIIGEYQYHWPIFCFSFQRSVTHKVTINFMNSTMSIFWCCKYFFSAEFDFCLSLFFLLSVCNHGLFIYKQKKHFHMKCKSFNLLIEKFVIGRFLGAWQGPE